MSEKMPLMAGPLVSFFSIVCWYIPLDMIESSDFEFLSKFFEIYFGLHLPSTSFSDLDATRDLAKHCGTFVLAFKKLFRNEGERKNVTSFVSNKIDFNYFIEILTKLIDN
jgi:hypothetical protein